MQRKRIVRILLVEDNPGDVVLVERSLKNDSVRDALRVVHDGRQALRYLRREGEFESVSRPDIIFLDLNVPILGGRKVLAEIKGDPELRRIPVVILTSSEAPSDINACYDLGANSFLTKAFDVEDYERVLNSAVSYWSEIVTLADADD